MPWYAVARGKKPGVYETWDECAELVKNFNGAKFRKFATQDEATAFVNEFGKKSTNKMEQTEMYENNTNTELSPCKTQTNVPSVSSPKLKANALKQRLKVIEKLYEDSMLELRGEIDSLKERIDNFNVHASSTSEMTAGTDTFKTLQESLSKLANSYRNSVEELKKEIGDLRTSIQSLDLELSQHTSSDKPSQSHLSSFKRNLFNSAVVPVAPKRLYSSKTEQTSKRKRRKSSIDESYNEDSPEVTAVQPSNNDNSQKHIISGFDVDESGYVKVYTDGACTKNGRVGARAGVGVFFGDAHPLNYSEPVLGRQTNNTAEIQAATCAIDLARKAGIKNLLINTDSEFLINCITIWIHQWKKRGWKVAGGEPVKNKEDLIALEQALEGMNVKWNHVRGHKGNHGNEMADALAKAGAQKKQ